MNDKTSINRAALLASAILVRPALASQNYIPALMHIRFTKGRATAFNDVSAIMVKSPLDIDRCLPGDLLIRALNSFSGEALAVQEASDGALVVTSGRARVKLPTLEVKAFPLSIPEYEGKACIELDTGMLKALQCCLISVGNDPSHPAQMGVTLDSDDDGKAVFFSTDNRTISRYQTASKIKLPADAPVILPTFFCEQLTTLARAYPKEDIDLYLLDGALLASFGKEATLFTKTLVDLEPLDFPRIVNKHCSLSSVKEDLGAIPDAFDGALGRALLVLGVELDKATKITANGSGFKMASSSAMGDADDSLEFDGALPDDPFHIDPALVVRAAKLCTRMAGLPRVLLMADDDAKFLHLIAHCHAAK